MLKNDWSINQFLNCDADGNPLLHTIDNVELVLSGLNPMERKGVTTTFRVALLPTSGHGVLVT